MEPGFDFGSIGGVDLRFSGHSWHRTGGYLAQASGNADRRRENAELISETIARSHKQKSPRAISPLMELDFDFGSAHGDGFRFCLHLR